VDEFFQSQHNWTKVTPEMIWNEWNNTPTKMKRKVKKVIKKSQARFKHYHDKKRRTYTIKKRDWVRVNKKNFP
jgi:hypothetical protein